MVDPQTRISRPVIPEIVPERVNALIGMEVADRIDPPLPQQTCVRVTALRLQQRVLFPGSRVVDVEIRGDDVEIPAQHHRTARAMELLRVLDESLEPGELVVELGPGLRVSVGEVEAADDEIPDRDLDVTTVR